MLTGGCDGADVDEVVLDNAVGPDEDGVVCSCSDDDGGTEYSVARLVGTSEYSDIAILLDIVDGAWMR